MAGAGPTLRWVTALNRPERAAQGYAKSAALLVYSVALLLANWNSKPNNSLC